MVTSIYNHIGKNYDLFRRADPEITSKLISLLKPIQHHHYLDIGCGTGNYTIALQKLNITMIGIDSSALMITQAQKKSSKIEWHLGSAENLPFHSASLDGAISTLAIHHFKNIQESFCEIFRVIRRGAFVIFTSEPNQMKNYWINEYFPKALLKSITQMPSHDQVSQSLLKAGFTNLTFEPFEITSEHQDFFLYSGKHHPERYLDPMIRSSISTFSSLADEKEIQNGCMQLKKDIETGKIHSIIESYQNTFGDYLFIKAEK